jgi:hypothetical protein
MLKSSGIAQYSKEKEYILIQKDIIARFNHFRRNIAIAAYTR